MKIAILINTFYKCRGMDYVAEQQAKELLENGHKVTVFTYDNDHLIEKVQIVSLFWPKNPFLNLIYRLLFPLDIFKIREYSNILKTYDIIIAHFYPITYLAWITKKKNPSLKYIFYNHGIGKSYFDPPLHRFYIKLIGYLTLVSISNADAIISISNFIQKQLSEKKVMQQIIYNKIDINLFSYQNVDNNSYFRFILDKAKSSPKFLYVGVLSKSKGIILLINSFKKVVKKYPEAKLFLVGTPIYGFYISDYISNNILNYTIFHFDHLEKTELGFMYNFCDVYVSASTWESFNLPIVEAQLLGKPTVAYRIGAHEEIVKDRETGILVEPFNTDHFADAMIQVYENREIMGKSAKVWAHQFSTEYSISTNISTVVTSMINNWIK